MDSIIESVTDNKSEKFLWKYSSTESESIMDEIEEFSEQEAERFACDYSSDPDIKEQHKQTFKGALQDKINSKLHEQTINKK